MLLQPIPEWHWDSLCGTRSPDLYDPELLPFNPQSAEYHPTARSRCTGCPVLQKCAAESDRYRKLGQPDTGVIRAGVPLRDSVERNDSHGLYKMLSYIAETGKMPPLPDVRQEGRGKHTEVFTGVPPLGSDTQFLYKGELYVGREGAARILGWSARKLDYYRKAGKIDVTVTYLRRSEKVGQAGAYYRVDDIMAAKERDGRAATTAA